MIRISYKNYLLAVMVLVGVVSVLDRFVFALVLEPIKSDLNLTDSQLGLMTGIAFAAFYAVAGIPIARWADTRNRVNLMTFTTGLLGIMLSLCSGVTSFFQLLLLRAGIAIGEAGCMPVGQSILADYNDRAERPKTMAIFAMFYPIAMIVGYLGGGWLVEAFGWRKTFLILGVPALLTALLVKLTLKEPRLKKTSDQSSSAPGIISGVKILWRTSTFRHVMIAFCVTYFFLMGTNQWLAAFYMRNHGMGTAELGAWLALCWGVFGILGNYLGGHLATRYAAGKERLQLRCLSVTFILGGVVSAVVYLAPSQTVSLISVAITAVLFTTCNGPSFSLVQSLVEERLRSLALAVLLLFSNLIGLGLGPLAIGILSDLLKPHYGDESLRYALTFSTPGVLWIAYHYWMAGSSAERDIENTLTNSATSGGTNE